MKMSPKYLLGMGTTGQAIMCLISTKCTITQTTIRLTKKKGSNIVILGLLEP
jgi:hypothetical protein